MKLNAYSSGIYHGRCGDGSGEAAAKRTHRNPTSFKVAFSATSMFNRLVLINAVHVSRDLYE
jgi:hypothetical protein